jgi:TBC1 domain family member 13
MANCIRLWDTLFSDEQRFDFINYVCTSIVVQIRDIILDGDFAECMEALQGQTKTIIDVPNLINKALEIEKTFLIEQAKEQMKQAKTHP